MMILGRARHAQVRKMLHSAVLALVYSMPAQAYQVDCAILLCLSGGWPASAECAHAKTVFIRRITPVPVEPPLQIWRCPMKAANNTGPGFRARERLYLSSMDDAPSRSAFGGAVSMLEHSAVFRHLAKEVSEKNGTADVDISGPEFEFVRSIKVWHVMHYSHRKVGRNEECREVSSIQLGTYGVQGDFWWIPSLPEPVPSWVIPSKNCEPGISVRAVGIEWTDYEGNHGHEVVNY